MEFIENIISWFEHTVLYSSYLCNLPDPLNNAYLDLLVVVLICIFAIIALKDAICGILFKIKLRREERILRKNRIERLKAKAINESEIESGRKKTATVSFIVDKKEVSKEIYAIGDSLTIPPQPKKSADLQYTYVFDGWKPEISPICNGNVTYKGTFTKIPKEYTITFYDEDGTLLMNTILPFGEKIKYKGVTPAKPSEEIDEKVCSYRFVGWSNKDGQLIKLSTVTMNQDLYATYTLENKASKEYEYQVQYYFDGVLEPMRSLVKTAPINKLVKADDLYSNEEYKLVDSTEDTVKKQGTVVSAYYEKQKYTVQFFNETTLLYEGHYNYNDIPDYIGVMPTKPATEKFLYRFAGWVSSEQPGVVTEFNAVNKDVIYKASFIETIREYTVKFMDASGNLHNVQQLNYGTMPSLPGEPNKEADEDYMYQFVRWDPSVTAVVSDAVYKPIYNKVVKETYDENGTEESAIDKKPITYEELDEPRKIDEEDITLISELSEKEEPDSKADAPSLSRIEPTDIELNTPEDDVDDLTAVMNALKRRNSENETLSDYTAKAKEIKDNNLKILEQKIDESLRQANTDVKSSDKSTNEIDEEWEKRKKAAMKLAEKDAAKKKNPRFKAFSSRKS